MIRSVASAVALVVLASGADARAESPYKLKLSVDLPVIGLGAAGALAAFVELPPPSCLPACDASRINALDRGVLGNYSESVHTSADVMVLSMLALPLVADLIDSGGDGWVTDATVYLETILLAQGLAQVTKAAVRRSAPFVYDASVPMEVKLTSADAPRAFPSGHATTAFAAATAFTVTFWLRHPDSPWRWVVLGLGAALGATVGALKIAAGYHFPTDIAGGAAIGVSTGALVPLLHTLGD